MPKNKGAHKYLLVLEIFCAVINFRTFHAMSRHLWFYDVTQFKLYWKIRNLEIRVHHHVSVLDWIPYTSNDSCRLQVHSTASLKKKTSRFFYGSQSIKIHSVKCSRLIMIAFHDNVYLLSLRLSFIVVDLDLSGELYEFTFRIKILLKHAVWKRRLPRSALFIFFLFFTNLLGKHYLGTHLYGALILNILNM